MKLLIMEFTYCQLQVLSLFISEVCVLKKHRTVFFNAYPTESLSNESLEEEVSSHAYTSHRTRHSSDLFTISCRKNIERFFLNQRQTQVSTFILKAVCGSRRDCSLFIVHIR